VRSGASPRHLNRRVRDAIAAALAVIGVIVIWSALSGPATPEPALAGAPQGHSLPPPASPSVPQPSPGRSAAKPAQPDVADRTTGLVLPESDPVSVSIPRIRVESTLVHLGLDRDGAMEVPRDPAKAGWYSRGAAPGALGPAVIAGHVTWNGSPAVFQRLGALRRGDQVTVTRKDRKIAVFRVDRVARFSKSEFPTQDVYGLIDHAGLRLITCGGSYDAARHRYPDNVVVFARLKAVRESR
jgi:LPXTG-site transpeptidase (sortase) family protein